MENDIHALLQARGIGSELEERFEPGHTPVPVSGKVLKPADYANLIEASLDGWLTSGRFHQLFEKKLAQFVGMRKASFVNSGSSANLLALSALTSPKLGKRSLTEGDEVITVAAGFPTTVNPIVQNRLVPVFVDVKLDTLDIDVNAMRSAVTNKTKAVMIAHTLGNPFDVDAVRALCDEHNLWLVEDSCDALGSEYKGERTGSFGDLSTLSFYPAHHITTGEGGMVFSKSPLVAKQVESFRDWGRDCWCDTGEDNTCKKRFEWQLGDLPKGYDHKYTYSHVGYNLKATDMQAALGLSQLDSLEEFIHDRRVNFEYLKNALGDLDSLQLASATEGSNPSWFGFPITIKPGVGFKRDELVQFLNTRKIGTRLIFAGNITKQPSYRSVNFRIHGSLENTDRVMTDSFWVGVYPGLSLEMLDYVVFSIREFVKSRE